MNALSVELNDDEPSEKTWAVYDENDEYIGDIILTYECRESYSQSHGITLYRESRSEWHFSFFTDDGEIERAERGSKYPTIKSALKAYARWVVEE